MEMGKITLRQAAAWCGGKVAPEFEDVTFLGATNDSRNIRQGELFIALQGARDGHDFIPMAMERGAAAVLCTHCEENIPAIVVKDTRLALGDIARGERERIGMKVIGVTGSVGKSTTKEMIASVLSGSFRVGKTPVNHNNDIGMPMAILAMPEDTQVAVLEMGMNHFREIAYLAAIAKPDVAVITNIGTMHIEHLGSVEGILQAKLEILEGMGKDGRIILNGDDPLLWNLHTRYPDQAVYFGIQNPDCTILGGDIKEKKDGLRFTVRRGESAFSVRVPVEGRHFVLDALAAITVGLEFGVDPAEIQHGLSQFHNLGGRQEIFKAKCVTIIKDCYNAGPASMTAALNVLGSRPGRHIAVLGDMLELGSSTQAEHYRVGRIAAEKADIVLCYGPNGVRVVNGAITGGMDPSLARAFTDQDALTAALRQAVKPGDVILFKGSRGMHMEWILDKFLKDET